jgi:hypothetical protein
MTSSTDKVHKTIKARGNVKKALLFRIVSLIFGVLLPLLASEILLRFLPVHEGSCLEPVNEVNPIWRFEPNRTFTYSSGWNFSIVNKVHSNNYGFINDVDYDESLASPLIAVIGDSYVEAIMVPFSNTITGRLAGYFAPAARVYSFARSGAPLSQYLVYAEYARTRFRPDRMIFVVVDNDFDESFEQYHYEGGHHHFVETSDGGIQLKRNDVSVSLTKKIARKSALLRYLILNLHISQFPDRVKEFFSAQGASEPYSVNTLHRLDPTRVAYGKRAVEAFFDKLPSSSGLEPQHILFVIDGMRDAIYRRADPESMRETYAGVMCGYFISAAQVRGYEVIDMRPLFAQHFSAHGRRFDYPTDSHWNELGHEVVFDAVIESDFLHRFVQEYEIFTRSDGLGSHIDK